MGVAVEQLGRRFLSEHFTTCTWHNDHRTWCQAGQEPRENAGPWVGRGRERRASWDSAVFIFISTSQGRSPKGVLKAPREESIPSSLESTIVLEGGPASGDGTEPGLGGESLLPHTGSPESFPPVPGPLWAEDLSLLSWVGCLPDRPKQTWAALTPLRTSGCFQDQVPNCSGPPGSLLLRRPGSQAPLHHAVPPPARSAPPVVRATALHCDPPFLLDQAKPSCPV